MNEPLLTSEIQTRPRHWVIGSFVCGVAATLAVLAVVPPPSPGGLRMGALQLLREERWCELSNFRNVVMKTVLDATIFGLLGDSAFDKKFEASGVVKEEHTFFVVCDSSWSIPALHDLSSSGTFDSIYNPRAPNHQRWLDGAANYLIPPADLQAFPPNVDSQWESITLSTQGNVHVTQESVVLKDGQYHAVIMDIAIQHNPRQWTLERACPSEFTFKDASKGFEGMLAMDGIDGRFFLLGLCEGNYCDTNRRGKEHGNGRIVIMELDHGEGPPNTFSGGHLHETSTCKWKTLRVVDIPAVAYFQDYSDLARKGSTIAISSQESAALLFADMTLQDGLLNPETFEITGGEVTRFAPTSTCQVQYCNVEGIEFINDRLLIASSDSMKGKGRQPYMCLEKDQSMHVFSLPFKVEV